MIGLSLSISTSSSVGQEEKKLTVCSADVLGFCINFLIFSTDLVMHTNGTGGRIRLKRFCWLS